ncbi:hypothetical protein [Kutzneria buriramensis]|uniref:Uncharacterized protein n=1 Tax=Kutzneria buriramensis TaxID=1045776 RepID=A0A3E0HGF1_9PSEU|nr:hypothetical protein [Kutzneria buriramensis]REH44799.1 hypothetical protein BCF44_108279 [Kutzneria buriramensis]
MRSVLLLVPLLFLVACGRCNLPMIPSPGIGLNAAAWFATHPGDTLHACVGERCQSVTKADAKRPVQLMIPARADPSATMRLTVTDGSGLTVRRDFAPVQHSVDGACGTVTWWETPATLTGDGRLQPG